MTVPEVADATVGTFVVSGTGSFMSFARPKSRSLAPPSFDTITFSGFRSRCTIPAPCAFASPSAIWTPRSSSLLVGTGPSPRSSRRVLPSTTSIAM
jgi:hypothetical protein